MGACTRPGELGLSLVEEQRAEILFTDTVTVALRTLATPPLIGSQPSRLLIGRLEDAVFGRTEAIGHINFRITSTNATFPNAVLDSIVLQLAYDTTGHYGAVNDPDVLTQETWEIARLTERLMAGETYNTDRLFGAGAVLARHEFRPRVRDSVRLADGTVLAPHLRIPLERSLGEELLNPTTNIYATNNTFKDAFRGFQIRAAATGNNASIVRFLPRNRQTKVVIYYNQPDDQGQRVSRVFELLTDEDSEASVYFEHDYQAGQGILANGPLDSLVYLQGMNGVGVDVQFPYLEALGNVVINKAELVLYAVEPVDVNRLRFPRQLISSLPLAGGEPGYEPSLDVSNSLSRAGNYLISGGALLVEGGTQGRYELNLSTSLQDLLRGRIPENRLFIQAASIINTERVILANAKHSRLAAKLRLTYTRLD